MATVEELDRLTALLTRLGPVSAQRVGDLIEAQDWNLLVEAVMEVARAVVADSTAPVPPHVHADQVSLGWLDPRLRTLVEQGPLGDPASLARVGVLERTDARLQSSLDALAAQVAELRERARAVATRDLEREAAVSVVRRKVDGLQDAREDVAQVRTSLEAVRERVSFAIELGERLQAGGVPVDLGALQQRVDSLHQLSDDLTLPTGERLGAAALERRLAELRNQLVTQEELDEVLSNRSGELSPEAEAALQGRLQAVLDASMTEREGALRADITTATEARLATVGELVALRLADATPGIREEVLAASRAELDQRTGGLLEQAGADADARVASAVAGVRRELEAGLSNLRGEISTQIGTELADRLPGALGDLRGSLEGLRADMAEIASRVERSREEVAGLGARVAEIDRGTQVGLRSLREEMKAGLAELSTRIDSRTRELVERQGVLDSRITAIDTSLEARVSRANAAVIRRLAAEAIDERFGPR